jgi:chromosome partitioning protein
VAAATKIGKNFRHAVIDTGQRMTDEQLKDAVEGCDLIVVPTVVSALDTDGLGQTIRALQQIPGATYRVLLTRVRPDALNDAAELRKLLAAMKAPVFVAQIPQLKAFEKAADLGVLVRDVDDPKAARCWAAYLAAGKELRG